MSVSELNQLMAACGGTLAFVHVSTARMATPFIGAFVIHQPVSDDKSHFESLASTDDGKAVRCYDQLFPCTAIVGNAHEVATFFACAEDATCHELRARAFDQPLPQGPAYHLRGGTAHSRPLPAPQGRSRCSNSHVPHASAVRNDGLRRLFAKKG